MTLNLDLKRNIFRIFGSIQQKSITMKRCTVCNLLLFDDMKHYEQTGHLQFIDDLQSKNIYGITNKRWLIYFIGGIILFDLIIILILGIFGTKSYNLINNTEQVKPWVFGPALMGTIIISVLLLYLINYPKNRSNEQLMQVYVYPLNVYEVFGIAYIIGMILIFFLFSIVSYFGMDSLTNNFFIKAFGWIVIVIAGLGFYGMIISYGLYKLKKH